MRQPVPFGKYLLLDRISVGGMAEVFKAKSYGVEGFEKIIAIKRILPTMGEDRDFIKMFIDEAKIAGQLAHANICQIFELGRIDGSHFIAMEYIWGKDLLQIQNRLKKNKQQMPIAMSCFAISKVLEGLDYAHRKRDPLGRPLEIVHRDCSPQNVLVSYEGEVKVIDFGIAKATSRNSRTMAGVLKGKFGYMSPEQVRGLPLDRRSDIFALGTMLYECLTGERLFQGETDFSTLEKVRNVDVQPPRAVNPNIPEAVEKIILKALAKDVDDRYQWCSEMLADLQQFLMGQDVVFTAKSLSSWLKETFAQEIERERQLLEQYKRVGRDGLIAGVPAAQAKLDVVENLGEAGKPEGDSTTLGGPNFEDMEAATGAQPDITGASPTVGDKRNSGKVAKADAGWDAPTATEPQDEGEADGDFGEEAPTEIFGDDVPAPPAAAAAPQPQPRAPSAIMPAKGPPKAPPPGRPSTARPAEQPMAAAPSGPVSMRQSAPAGMGADPLAQTSPAPVSPSALSQPNPYAQPFGGPSQMPVGTPGAMPQGDPAQLGQASGQPAKTVLGIQAPAGLGNYNTPSATPPGMSFRPSQPASGMPSGYPQAPGGYPSSPQMQQPGMGGYGGYSQSGPMAQSAVEPLAPVVEGKKSTLMRDIGIGVAIAALVLVGFLVVKMFVLDKGGDGKDTQTSSMATIKIALTGGVTAELFVDEMKVAVVKDGDSIPMKAGLRRVKLVGPNNARCEEPVKLDAGQTTTLECSMASAGSAVGSGSAVETATGSAATGSAGSAAVQTGSAAPQTGSAAAGNTAGSAMGSAVATNDTKPGNDVKTGGDTKTGGETKTGTKTVPHGGETKTGGGSKTGGETKTSGGEVKTAGGETKTGGGTKTGGDTKAGGGADDPTKGYLQLGSKPSAKIFIDGADTGKKTPAKIAVSPGKHKISFVLGEDKYTYPVVTKAGETTSMDKDLQ